MATIEAIAKVSGVSPATVSRVLRNAQNVSPATRELVLKTATQLGRSLPAELQGKRVLAIGSTNVEQFFSSLDEAARQHNITLLWKHAKSDDYMSDDLFSMEEYDGVVLIDGVMAPQALQLLREKRPVVQCRTYSGLSSDVSVLVDDFQMGFDLTELLLRRGCRRIMYLNTSDYFSSRPFARDRLRGAMAAACEAGTKLDRICTPLHFDNCPELVRQALQDGIDGLILGMIPPSLKDIYQVFDTFRVRIPEDLAIASFDDSDSCEVFGITAIRQPFDSIASTAMLLLCDLIEQRAEFTDPIYVRTKHRLVERASTKRV